MRKTLIVMAALFAAGVAGCTANGSRDALSIQSAGENDEENLIIVAVENGTHAGPPRPASTRPGYGGAAYRASDTALAEMRAVALEYGLTEVAAWPIQVLTLHCAVLRIPAGASRDELLQKIAIDRRVKLAQAMNGFTPRSQPYNNRSGSGGEKMYLKTVDHPQGTPCHLRFSMNASTVGITMPSLKPEKIMQFMPF